MVSNKNCFVIQIFNIYNTYNLPKTQLEVLLTRLLKNTLIVKKLNMNMHKVLFNHIHKITPKKEILVIKK